MVDLSDLVGNEATRKNQSLEEDAYLALKGAIRDNVFPPGYQGSELEIAARLGMSRTPVHNAVIRLQEEGLVRIRPRRGIVVCGISADDMREIYDVIIALESMSAWLLASQSHDRRILVADELDRINSVMKDALRDSELIAWAKGDAQFHRVLWESCGNRRIARFAHTVMDQAHRTRMVTLNLRPKPIRSAAEHRALTEAIRSGDVVRARDCALAHRTRDRDELVPLLAQFGMKHL